MWNEYMTQVSTMRRNIEHASACRKPACVGMVMPRLRRHRDVPPSSAWWCRRLRRHGDGVLLIDGSITSFGSSLCRCRGIHYKHASPRHGQPKNQRRPHTKVYDTAVNSNCARWQKYRLSRIRAQNAPSVTPIALIVSIATPPGPRSHFPASNHKEREMEPRTDASHRGSPPKRPVRAHRSHRSHGGTAHRSAEVSHSVAEGATAAAAEGAGHRRCRSLLRVSCAVGGGAIAEGTAVGAEGAERGLL